MKYVSIDLETTGLDAEQCQIIEFGAVYDDLSKPFNVARRVFHRFVRHPVYTGEPYALAMNQKILYTLAAGKDPDICDVKNLADVFHSWLYGFGMELPIVVAGKNFAGFDKPFLRHVPFFNALNRLHHRCLDPGSMYFDPTRDEVVPSTQECLRRAGLDDTVSHTAVEDAMDVCRLIRWKLLGSAE
jgi:hypothetical protein